MLSKNMTLIGKFSEVYPEHFLLMMAIRQATRSESTEPISASYGLEAQCFYRCTRRPGATLPRRSSTVDHPRGHAIGYRSNTGLHQAVKRVYPASM